jgi:uncharacterized protein (DUF2141 family)
MKKGFVFWGVFLLFCAAALYAEDVPLIIEFQGVVPNGGTVYVAIFYRADSYRKQIPEYALSVEPTAETVRGEISIPEGEYLVSCYQDANGNGKADTGPFGIPRELISLTNYSGKGLPGGFNKLKIPIYQGAAAITLRLYKVKI